MDVTAQDPNVNDIWSTPNQPVQGNFQSSASGGSIVSPVPKAGSSKPGLAGSGESGGWGEVPSAEDLLEKARKEEAEQVAELYKAPEVPGSVEVGEKLTPAEVLRSPENLKSPKPQENKSPAKLSPKVIPQEESLKGKVVDKRTGKEKTHRVDINNADAVTKTADLKEQDFIEHVEKEHIQSIL